MARNLAIFLLFLGLIGSGAAVPAQASPKPDFLSKILVRMDKEGANDQTLWNLGFLWFNQYGTTLEMAQIISEAYTRAGAKVSKPIIKKSADYWGREVKYWGRTKPGDLNQRPAKPFAWLPRGEWDTSLIPFAPGDPRNRSDNHFSTRYNSRYSPPDRRGWKSEMKMFRSRGR